MNLHAREIIDIVYDENKKLKLVLNEKVFKEEEILANDIYIINTLVLNKEKFTYTNWKKILITTYRENIMIRDSEESDEKQAKIVYIGIVMMFLILIVAIIVPFFTNSITLVSSVFMGTSIAIIVGLIFYVTAVLMTRSIDDDIHLEKYAKEELKKWFAFENFVESYTILKEREAKEVILYGRYLPYAMCLDINKKYKNEFIKMFPNKAIIDIRKIIEDQVFEDSLFLEVMTKK